MQRFLYAALTVLSLAAAPGAGAFPMTPDPTGLWYQPDDPGWGASVMRQGEVLFVVLFVYDAARKPEWYVAPDVRDTGTHYDPLGAEVYSGTLYRTNGPGFAGPANPPFGATAVGRLDIAQSLFGGNRNLLLTFTIDGARIGKTLSPQTWASPLALWPGRYSGGVNIRPSRQANCAPPPSLANPELATLEASAGASNGDLALTWRLGADAVCEFRGRYSGSGQRGSAVGPLTCSTIAGPQPTGTLTLTDIVITENGFSGSAALESAGCTHAGTLGGVRQP